ncbi:MAG: hypothetical protein APF81_25035 [Desulfosporosinus sp. BRH_c37]|nr:MAG: hypothetical protein APF81_25035 [Desulfosporosinus sp. BRH_c37]
MAPLSIGGAFFVGDQIFLEEGAIMKIKKLGDISIPEKHGVIEDLIYSYKSFQLLKTAIDSRLFDWLEEFGLSTQEEVSKVVNVHGLFMKGYLQTLVELGFLVQSGNQYSNSSIASSLLTRDKETYQGEWLSITASFDCNNLFSLFRSENPAMELYHDNDFPNTFRN